ncbi:hypothetical protein [uncultured Friedmanniella sp.]|uniref:hypothetical protein n=1 Tax=uncultured Friedmanniella sp. TaxID=335381 RepID=UPI0035C9F83B
MADEKQITVEENGEVLARASVSVSEETHDARAQVHVAPGHLPAGTRQKMADAVHDAVSEDDGRHLTASVPLGDAELVRGLGERMQDVSLRAAGATSIIEGQIRPT